MEPLNQSDDEELKKTQNDDSFSDAVDDFPFHDCPATDGQSGHSESSSTVTASLSEASPEASSPASTLRRRSISRRGAARTAPEASNLDQSSSGSHVTEIRDSKVRFREKRNKIYGKLKGKEENSVNDDRVASSQSDSAGVVSNVGEDKGEEVNEECTATTVKDGRNGDSVNLEIDLVGELGSSSWLVYIAALVIKAIGFQFNLFVYFLTFPIWVMYNSYMLVVDPFGVIRRCRSCLMRKFGFLWNLVGGKISSLVSDWLKKNKTVWNFFLQFGWGLFWSIYVGIVLCGLLVFSVMVSGFFMRYLAEKPLQIREDLNFDYTKNSPAAYVPIRSCSGVGCGVNCEVKVGDMRSSRARFIPPNHKLQATISLTLPESEYNRNLGMFQVRVEFLTADGKTLASKSHPCMLKFKSQPIQILMTFLKVAPLVTGYISESQQLQLKIRGFNEGDLPTSCLKVTIERRAEFRPGAGIPEIYDASLTLESELPLFKRIIWCWKKTIFVWISIISFVMELLFTLVCCRSLLIPRTRMRESSSGSNSIQNNAPEQS